MYIVCVLPTRVVVDQGTDSIVANTEATMCLRLMVRAQRHAESIFKVTGSL